LVSSAGVSRRQRSVTKGQRGAKAQPMISSRSDGTMPGISASRGAIARPRLAPKCGTELSKPTV
jgi:hypothetical protein